MKPIFYLTIFLSFRFSFSQPTLEWAARYSSGEALAMALDKFGNIYVAGTGGMGLTYDYVTIKYNSVGQQLWVQTYNGPNNLNDAANAIAVDDSGNVYVTGESFMGYVGKNQDWDYVTIKYNTNGFQQWVRTYNTPPNRGDFAFSLCLDENANVFVTGVGGGAIVTIKYDRNGVQQWLAQYIGIGGENKGNKIVYRNGFVYVTGYSSGSGSYWDYATVKYNSATGVQQWVARYNGTASQDDEACCIAVDDTGNVFVGGSSVGSNNDWNAVTIKYNSLGVQQWVYRYLGTEYSMMHDLIIDQNNNIYVTGDCISISNFDYLTVKYNSSGVQQWVNIYNSGYSDIPNSIAIDKQNNIYVTGWSQFPPPIRRDIITIKYNSNGTQQWLMQYNSPFSNREDVGNVILVDSSINVYVTGRSGGFTGGDDFITLKYSQAIGIQNLNEFVSEFKLFQNYPNPFNSSTAIEFSILHTTFVHLSVFNILGNQIENLITKILAQGKYRIIFDASKFGSGIYFYRLTTEQNTLSKKLILIK